MIPDLSQSVFSAEENVDPTETGIAAARRRAVGLFGRAGLGGAQLFSIELSIHEALVNAFVHGVTENGATRIRLTYGLAGGRVRVVVEDNGVSLKTRGSDRDHLKAAGRGLFLIRAFSSRARAVGSTTSMELDFDTDTNFRSPMNPKTVGGLVCCIQR
jgi:anti-sigma regulatory factor (Ser/Thr protein kinase)